MEEKTKKKQLWRRARYLMPALEIAYLILFMYSQQSLGARLWLFVMCIAAAVGIGLLADDKNYKGGAPKRWHIILLDCAVLGVSLLPLLFFDFLSAAVIPMILGPLVMLIMNIVMYLRRVEGPSGFFGYILTDPAVVFLLLMIHMSIF